MRNPSAIAAAPSPPPDALTTNVFFAAADRTRQSLASTNVSEFMSPVSVSVSQRTGSSRTYRTYDEQSQRVATETSAARIFRYVFTARIFLNLPASDKEQ